jgi:putative pyruvate formate lyase activating enzyme
MDLTAHKSISQRRETINAELATCKLCPHDCRVNRLKGEVGFCGLDSAARCFREMIHNGEEKQLVPSHQIYFAGCNLKCEYCSVVEWNRCPLEVEGIATEQLAEKIANRRTSGARTLNFLGGEPSVNIYGILGLLELVDPAATVVWNSNMYYRDIAGGVLEGLADIFLADFKCFDSNCSRDILGVTDYSEIVRSNIKHACQHSDVIVRHLALPGHFHCCTKPILEWIASEIPTVKVSLRLDYIPPIPAEFTPAGYMADDQKQAVLDAAKELKLNLIE